MYSNIIIVSLLQITLAAHFTDQRPFLRSRVNSQRQFYYRNPDSENYGEHRDTQNGNTDFGVPQPNLAENVERTNYQRYVDPNTNVYQNGNVQRTDQDIQNNEKTDYTNKYQPRHDNTRGRSRESSNSQDEGPYKNTPETDFEYRNQPENPTEDVNEASLKTNLDSQPKEYTSDSRTKSTEYAGSASRRRVAVKVRKSQISGNSRNSNQSSIDLSAPELKARNNDAQETDDKLSMNEQNGETLIVADNPEPSSIKTTTDNEVNNTDKDTDKWVWNTEAPITTTTLSDGGLDDRVALGADGCPAGHGKVLGQCVKKAR